VWAYVIVLRLQTKGTAQSPPTFLWRKAIKTRPIMGDPGHTVNTLSILPPHGDEQLKIAILLTA
jgi:hypothetical protein